MSTRSNNARVNDRVRVRLGQMPGVAASARSRIGFTLIEVLIVVVMMGIAASLLIPSMGQTGVLRVQAAVRTIVSDIIYIQGEAVAYQSRRAIWFGKVAKFSAGGWTFVDGNGYVIAEVNGPTLDLAVDFMEEPGKLGRPYSRNFDDAEYGGASIDGATFDGDAILIFDELGGPVATFDGPAASNGGMITVNGSGSSWVIQVEPYTGRVTVTKTADISH